MPRFVLIFSVVIVRRLFPAPILLALLACFLTPAAHAELANLVDRLAAAQRDPAQVRQLVDAGPGNTTFCANCHGQNGNSAIPEVPNLAGQNPAYLIEQMQKFERGERKNPFMQGLIKVLGADERMSIALFYSAARPQSHTGAAGNVARGRDLFRSRCAACHGESAHGSDRFPRLAGQHPVYLTQSLTRYRDRAAERGSKEMSGIASALADAEIRELANYLSTLP